VKQKMNRTVIAPCGMNCGLCIAYQREEKKCDGCNGDDITKPFHCVKCVIKNCPTIQSNQSGLCYDCNKFPCRRLKHLDARYVMNYRMSMLKNLEDIKKNGINTFLKLEAERWSCKNCGTIICVHKGMCFNCKTTRTE
jgi:hypothetical protein